MNQFVAYLIHSYYIPLVSPWSLSWRMKLVWISWAASWCRRWRPGPGWRPPLWRRCPACCPRRCGRCCVCWVSAPRPPWRMSPGDHRCADILTLTPVKEKNIPEPEADNTRALIRSLSVIFLLMTFQSSEQGLSQHNICGHSFNYRNIYFSSKYFLVNVNLLSSTS